MFSDILLTVDYDRTLTAPDSTVPQRNLDAIRWFMENGGTFTVNTGRSLPMAQAFKDKVPVNAPLLLYTGAAAYDVARDELVFMQEIRMDMWKTVHELLDMFPDLTVEVQALDKHYDFLPNPAWDAFSECNCAYATAEEGQDLGPFLKFSLYGEIKDTTVDQLYRGTPEEIRRMDEAEKLLNEVEIPLANVLAKMENVGFEVDEQGIKDYGNIMPGHGGVMDRFDSVIFAAPVVYYFIEQLPIFI